MVQVTITGIGGPNQTATIAPAGSPSAGGPRLTLTVPDNSGGGGAGNIELEALSSGSFSQGTRGAGGMRYLWATFRVRNAAVNGSAYDTPRQNLTFLAASYPGTLEGSAVSRMATFDGTAVPGSVAAQMVPTGAVPPSPGDGGVSSDIPDVLQVFTEAEVDSLAPPAWVTTIFPYGFVVRRNGDNTTRALPASPAAGQFDGIVTFAYRVPLQATAAEDPYTVDILFAVRDDSETRITQSLEEQNTAGNAAVEARSISLGASYITLLPGSTYAGAGTTRLICQVRTAGTAAAPTAFLVDACPPP